MGHSDDEPPFQATVRDALIMSLSIGATRLFRLRCKDGHYEDTRIFLNHGDLCTMEGLCQKHYRHCVPMQEDEPCSARINLTWRWVVQHQPHCPLFTGTSTTAST